MTHSTEDQADETVAGILHSKLVSSNRAILRGNTTSTRAP